MVSRSKPSTPPASAANDVSPPVYADRTEDSGRRVSAQRAGHSGNILGPAANAQPATAEVPFETDKSPTLAAAWLANWLSRCRGWLAALLRLGDRQHTPAFLVSLIFHVSLLLLLALLSWTQSGGTQRSFDFTAATHSTETTDLTEAALLTAADAAPPAPIADTSPEPPNLNSSATSAVLSELLREPSPVPLAPQANTFSQLLQATANSPIANFAGTGVQGRAPAQRRQIALARGGTLESEQAVELALEWLAAHQLPSGGWSLIHDTGKCRGQCPNNGSPDRFDPAATGLSLLAFLGAGYTHREGKYRDTVRRGVYFLQQIMEETPQGGSFLHQSERGMYNHGIAAFALCEAYQMTQDKDLKVAAQKSIDFIGSAQNYQGGWGYLPKQPGDLTLSGWQIMALKSAYAAGLEVHPATIVRIDPFLDSQQTENSFFYGYGRPGKSTTCTAIGLLLRLFRGMSATHPTVLDGANFISKVQRPGPDAYFNYYSTLMLFHAGGPFWENWNVRMREHLIATQSKQGHLAGSWFFDDPYGREGGRVYTTAMSAMTLEVYYRFAPIYQQADVKFEL